MQKNREHRGKKSILHKAFIYDRNGMSVQWERAFTFQ